MGFLTKIKGSFYRSEQPRDPVHYDEQKRLAHKGDAAQRMALATDPQTHQEILYYLATHDADAAIRQAVARNITTPVQASTVLAVDKNVDVRMALAERLLKLLPDLDQGRQSQLYAFAVQALGALALDEVLNIRKALSSTLKDYAHAPQKLVAQLARDLEQEVAEPILRFCTALADEDLLDILKNHKADWALSAIAARAKVSAQLSHAVIGRGRGPSGAILIGNAGADITVELMKSIIEQAKTYPEWHKPLASHAKLPADMARALAAYADASVRDILDKRSDFDAATKEEIATVFRRRLDYAEKTAQTEDTETPVARARRLDRAGKLDEKVIIDALAMRDRAFVMAALAQMAEMDLVMVEKIFALKAPKPIVALSRKAGLAMRTALQLQQDVGQVPPKELLYPRGGTDYPLSDEEMARQLEFLGAI